MPLLNLNTLLSGLQSLPDAVRKNRLEERKREAENFTQLLNVTRVTQAFEEQELRKAKFEESLSQSNAIERANTLLGDAVRTGDIQEAIGPLSEAFGEGGLNPATSLSIFQKLQPEQEKEAATFEERFAQMSPKEQQVQVDALKKIAGARKGSGKGEITGLNTNQARVLTGQIDGAIRGEKRLTDSRVKTLRKAIKDLQENSLPGDPPDPAIPEMQQRLNNLEDYLKFLNTGAAKDSVTSEFLQTIDFIEDETK